MSSFEQITLAELRNGWTVSVKTLTPKDLKDSLICVKTAKTTEGQTVSCVDPASMTPDQARLWHCQCGQANLKCPSQIQDKIDGKLPTKMPKATICCSAQPIFTRKEGMGACAKQRDAKHRLIKDGCRGSMSGEKDHAMDNAILKDMGGLGRDAPLEPDCETLYEEMSVKHHETMEAVEKVQTELVREAQKTYSTVVHPGKKGRKVTTRVTAGAPVWSDCTGTEADTPPGEGVCIAPTRTLRAGEAPRPRANPVVLDLLGDGGNRNARNDRGHGDQPVPPQDERQGGRNNQDQAAQDGHPPDDRQGRCAPPPRGNEGGDRVRPRDADDNDDNEREQRRRRVLNAAMNRQNRGRNAHDAPEESDHDEAEGVNVRDIADGIPDDEEEVVCSTETDSEHIADGISDEEEEVVHSTETDSEWNFCPDLSDAVRHRPVSSSGDRWWAVVPCLCVRACV